ncbi:hypothetical protein [Salmonella phage PKM.Hi.22.6]|uniref:Uncharacterized protein n=1 Tax=phage PKM.Lu.22.1 TaxID=3049197 RepID=A0AAF0KYH0_9CAUD|nr:hypothetical protein [phage PKM.Lu.22.1]WKV17093.1 hypothetical protein [Salmonella phage PKM.Hi.22.6]
MDNVVYENDKYVVTIDEGLRWYNITNKTTNVREVEEPSLPTAKFKADALVGALKQFDEKN